MPLPPLLLTLAMAPALATPALDALFADAGGPRGPGCAVDVRRGADVLARRSYGLADLEDGRPIDPDTVFEAGSVSKQFIGAGIALLASRGILSLDDPVRRWLPELPPRYREVTLRMMLNHTSGIRNWDNLAELTGLPEGTRTYDRAWVLRAVSRQTALNNAPGAEYLYSNSNYVLAGIIVERAARRPLDDFYRAELFGPLGLTRTTWRTDYRTVVPGRAQAYLPAGPGRWLLEMPFGNVVGAGGLLSTVGDLQRWNAALAEPRPEDRRWVALMTEPGRLRDGTRTRYALGLELDDVAGAQAVSHAGATASYRAWLGRFPATGLSVAILCNAGGLNTEELGPAVAALYLPAAASAQAVPPPSRPVAADLAGTYRNAANDAAVEAVIAGGAVRFGGGTRFLGRSDGLLATAGGTRTATVARRGGAVARIVLSRIGNAPVVLLRERAPRTGPAAAADYAGRYRSPDVDGQQRFVVAGGGLRWVDPAGAGQALTPVYADGFEARDSSWTLRFRRDPRGRVAGVDMSITRARRIHFARVRR